MTGDGRQAFWHAAANGIAEAPVYVAAASIAWLLKEHLPIRLGEDATTMFFGIGLGFGGVWLGRYECTKK